MSEEFIGEEIKVHFERMPGPPICFTWGGAEHRIDRVVRAWRQLDFQRPWWRRRHRDHYVVETETGELFELYHHRKPGRSQWVLYRRLKRNQREGNYE